MQSKYHGLHGPHGLPLVLIFPPPALCWPLPPLDHNAQVVLLPVGGAESGARWGGGFW
jgi:hypothetical protein